MFFGNIGNIDVKYFLKIVDVDKCLRGSLTYSECQNAKHSAGSIAAILLVI